MKQVVYACSRPSDINILYRSAQSIRTHLSDSLVSVYVTSEVHNEIDHSWTDSLHLVEARYHHRPRFEAMRFACDGPTLFLDCDTLAVGSLDSLFEVLGSYDIAMCPAVNMLNREGLAAGVYELLPAVSDAIGEWNGGMMLARVNDKFRAMASQWMWYYDQCHAQGYRQDQAALRVAVNDSQLRVATLRNNHNFRTFAQQTVVGEVKILHGKGDLATIAKTINQTTTYRLYTPTPHAAENSRP